MDQLKNLIDIFAKLPGLGPRSSKRIVLHLIQNKNNLTSHLVESIKKTMDSIVFCSECRNIDSISPCYICADNLRRDKTTICVVENISDLWTLEKCGNYSGLYHVLGGTLSAIDGNGPEELNIDLLIDRVVNHNVRELIFANNSTMQGQTTVFYIMDRLQERLAGKTVKITTLAQGVPIGSELDYLDEGTISTAIKERRLLDN